MKRIVTGDVIMPSVAVAGYPRELEAIILTALASDPGARFQTAQEMIEAIDAFAVRSKLTGSSTALGRFMTQLFGSKREPWVGDEVNADPTQISETSGADLGDTADTAADDDDNENDNEKTAIMVDGMAERLAAQAEVEMPSVAPVWEPHEIPAATPSHGMPTAPPPGPPPPLRLGTEPTTQSEPGAQPLIDEQLGWTTGIKPMRAADPELDAARRRRCRSTCEFARVTAG